MPFYRGTRLPIIGSGAQNTSNFLPAVGPFAASGIVSVSSLSDFSLSNRQLFSSLRGSPKMYNNFTISGTGDYDIDRDATGSAHFIWINNGVINGTLESGGGRGGTGGGGGGGGAGASGGSGAGGGAAGDSALAKSGGVAGSGVDGTAGHGGDQGNGGTGGLGWANSTYVLDGYPYPIGGNGDSIGGVGFGGAGDGMSNPGAVLSGFGGGGGGGGLVVLVCNSLSGSGLIYCAGGPGGVDFGMTGIAMGGGGGGILVMARSYTGLITTAVNGRDGGTAGNAEIYKINANNTLTQKLFTDSW